MHIVSKRRIDVYRTSLLFRYAISSLTDMEQKKRKKKNLLSGRQQSDHPSLLFISVCQLVNIEHADRHTSSMLVVCNLSHEYIKKNSIHTLMVQQQIIFVV
jgi:hypothetical protein